MWSKCFLKGSKYSIPLIHLPFREPASFSWGVPWWLFPLCRGNITRIGRTRHKKRKCRSSKTHSPFCPCLSRAHQLSCENKAPYLALSSMRWKDERSVACITLCNYSFFRDLAGNWSPGSPTYPGSLYLPSTYPGCLLLLLYQTF